MAVLAFNMALLCSVPIVAKSVNGDRKGVRRPIPHCMAQQGYAGAVKFGVAEAAIPPCATGVEAALWRREAVAGMV